MDPAEASSPEERLPARQGRETPHPSALRAATFPQGKAGPHGVTE